MRRKAVAKNGAEYAPNAFIRNKRNPLLEKQAATPKKAAPAVGCHDRTTAPQGLQSVYPKKTVFPPLYASQ
jgi:hypothetical protein